MANFVTGSGAVSMSGINSVFGRGYNLNSYRGTQYYINGGGQTAYAFNSNPSSISMSNFYGTGPVPNYWYVQYFSGSLITYFNYSGWNQLTQIVGSVAIGPYTITQIIIGYSTFANIPAATYVFFGGQPQPAPSCRLVIPEIPYDQTNGTWGNSWAGDAYILPYIGSDFTGQGNFTFQVYLNN